MTTYRQTKYCNIIEESLRKLGHATNLQLLKEIQKTYPTVSATTIHRATARLSKRNLINIAPPARDGSVQYDANNQEHDHFRCEECGLMIDTDIKDKVSNILKQSIDNCEMSGRITISGICKKCNSKKGVKYENNNL